MLLMCRACPLPRQTSAIKTLCQFPCAKGKLQCKKSKQTSGKYFFQCKKRQTAGFFFVVEVFVLQKYKSKNNNDFLENAFIMSFSVFINAFFVQFGCIKQNVHVAFVSAVSFGIAYVVC